MPSSASSSARLASAAVDGVAVGVQEDPDEGEAEAEVEVGVVLVLLLVAVVVVVMVLLLREPWGREDDDVIDDSDGEGEGEAERDSAAALGAVPRRFWRRHRRWAVAGARAPPLMDLEPLDDRDDGFDELASATAECAASGKASDDMLSLLGRKKKRGGRDESFSQSRRARARVREVRGGMTKSATLRHDSQTSLFTG